jgi:hypothetical protein
MMKNNMDHISTFRIPIEKIPQAKNWKVGGRYQIVADVEQVGVNKERDYSSERLGPVSLEKRSKERPKYRTMIEFKVFDVRSKDAALKKKIYG